MLLHGLDNKLSLSNLMHSQSTELLSVEHVAVFTRHFGEKLLQYMLFENI